MNLIQDKILLSDSLVRPVLARTRPRHQISHVAESLQHCQATERKKKLPTAGGECSIFQGIVNRNPSGNQVAAQGSSKMTVIRKSTKTPHRPDNSSGSRVSYYDKQRDSLLRLEQDVNRLHRELQHSKDRRRDLAQVTSFGRNSPTMVAKMFTLLDTNFRSLWRMKSAAQHLRHTKPPQKSLALQSFAGDAGFGDLYGMTALTKQLRCYWYYFEDPTIQLQRVDSEAPGIVTATAKISITVSDFTVQVLFSHLQKAKRTPEGNDAHRPSRDQLLGQRFHCECVITFFLDEETSRVSYVSTSVDLVGPLLHAIV